MNVARVTLRDLGDSFTDWSQESDPDRRVRYWSNAGTGAISESFWSRWARPSAPDDWSGGGSGADLRGWLANGYELPGVTFQDSDLAALRERPRWTYSDSDGDYRYDLDESGIPECYARRANRPSIPGIRVEVELSVDCDVNGANVREYGAFVIRSLSALEAAGIDLAVYARISSQGSFKANGTSLSRLIITCKREGEAMDYRYFSPIFSPAGFRVLGFYGLMREADSYNRKIAVGLGRTLGGSSVHKVTYDPSSQAIVFTPANNRSTALDTNRLTAELLTALDESRRA